jgi:hypothetical protein
MRRSARKVAQNRPSANQMGDFSMVKTIQILGAAAMALGLGLSSAQAQTGDFDPANMRCLDFVNGQGDGATNKGRADLARIWIMGYMAGNYTGREKLEWTDESDAEEKAIGAVLSKCRENPEVTLLTVSEFVSSDRRRDLPNTLSNDFNPQTYMCGDYADGREGAAADVLKADLADVWAFAFVQGYVNTDDPDLMIPVENKPAITGAIAGNCAKNREFSFFNLTAAVAPMVSPQ